MVSVPTPPVLITVRPPSVALPELIDPVNDRLCPCRSSLPPAAPTLKNVCAATGIKLVESCPAAIVPPFQFTVLDTLTTCVPVAERENPPATSVPPASRLNVVFTLRVPVAARSSELVPLGPSFIVPAVCIVTVGPPAVALPMN